MNSKLLLSLVAIIVIAGGFFFLSNKTQAPAPTQNQPEQTQATSAPSPTTAMIETTVTLTADGFSPQTLTVKAGTTVTWTNKSGEMGNVSSDPHPVHTNYTPLNLGRFAAGTSLTLTFDKPGTYGYHNHLNSVQTGTIIVQ